MSAQSNPTNPLESPRLRVVLDADGPRRGELLSRLLTQGVSVTATGAGAVAPLDDDELLFLSDSADAGSAEAQVVQSDDAGDGPAVFVILILGFIVVGLALWVELAFEPPFWVHALLWVPLIVGGALLMLRPLKATLVTLHYKHRHEDGA